MCGIVGFIKKTPLIDEDVAAVRRANNAMSHRGPDGEGEYFGRGLLPGSLAQLFMAMRRLSIIDLSHGWQPLKSTDEALAVIANGEVYNYVELRQQLAAAGHQFRTGSDCEVIPHLYEEFGLDFVNRMRGMYAFAMWDSRNSRLILGRDRMGEKPLYLYECDEGLWFASELKVLLATRRMPCKLNPTGIHNFLHYGWIPEPETGLEGIRKLPAGHMLIVDVANWQVKQQCYWRLEDVPMLDGDPRQLIRSELDTIGRLIVRADVPIGVALSGGFDSTLVAALASRHNSSPITTFTVGYEGMPGQDERPLAAQYANAQGFASHSIAIADSDMVAAFPRLAFDRDDPIADIAGYGYHVVSRLAREHGCPVLLQGQGADELLWGYPWAVQAVVQSIQKFGGKPQSSFDALLHHLPRGIARPQLVRFAYILGGLASGWRMLSPGKHSASDSLVLYDLNDPFQVSLRYVRNTYSRQFNTILDSHAVEPRDFFRYQPDGCRIDIQVLSLLCRGYLLQNGIAQGDRLSMANSIELRLPLVDYRFAEIIVGLQKRNPIYMDRPKKILVEATRDLVPGYVTNRPKRGFTPPVSRWVSALRARYASDLVNGALVEDCMLDRNAAENLAKPTGRFSANYLLLQKYLTLEFWYRGMRHAAGLESS